MGNKDQAWLDQRARFADVYDKSNYAIPIQSDNAVCFYVESIMRRSIVHFSIVISKLSEENKILTHELGLLRIEIEKRLLKRDKKLNRSSIR